MRVSFVKSSKSKGYLNLGITEDNGKYVYTVSETVYAEIGSPCRGAKIDRGMLESICDADERYRAKSIALRLLSYADNNERSLQIKLVSRGISREVAREVIDQMVSVGYINEKRQLERLILKEANVSLAGPKKIIPKLMAKGYAHSDIEEVLSSLCASGEIDFDKNKRELIAKNATRGAVDEQINKFLYKNGYSVGE